jgi:hypothetical protein
MASSRVDNVYACFCAKTAELPVSIGIPKEIKADEYRVGLIPSTIKELVAGGHDVKVETRVGDGAGISDEQYFAAGARIAPTAEAVFQSAELIVKLKGSLSIERSKLRHGQVTFTYLHLAPDREETREFLAWGVTTIAYETVTDAAGKLPLSELDRKVGLDLRTSVSTAVRACAACACVKPDQHPRHAGNASIPLRCQPTGGAASCSPSVLAKQLDRARLWPLLAHFLGEDHARANR